MVMKYLICSLFIFFLVGCDQSRVSYLDQEIPGDTPVLFASGIVNTDSVELNAVFNRNMTEFYFTRIINGSFVIHQSKRVEGKWSSPEAIDMHPGVEGLTMAVDMTLSPDGNSMYFLGKIPTDSSWDIYTSQKKDGEWQPASKVPAPISTDEYAELYPVVVDDGSMYFISDRPGGVGRRDVYRAQYLGNGEFDTPVSLGPTINSEMGSGDTFVAPDESYLIYGTSREENGMHVAFKKDGEWQEPIYLGEPINTEVTDFCPYVSADGKFFFFSRRYSDPPESGWDGVTEGEVYWMDIKPILELGK